MAVNIEPSIKKRRSRREKKGAISLLEEAGGLVCGLGLNKRKRKRGGKKHAFQGGSQPCHRLDGRQLEGGY